MTFSKLRGVMAEKAVTQDKLAKKIGITTQALNSKLNGRTQFTLSELICIIDYLGISNPEDIFFDKMSQKCNDCT